MSSIYETKQHESCFNLLAKISKISNNVIMTSYLVKTEPDHRLVSRGPQKRMKPFPCIPLCMSIHYDLGLSKLLDF